MHYQSIQDQFSQNQSSQPMPSNAPAASEPPGNHQDPSFAILKDPSFAYDASFAHDAPFVIEHRQEDYTGSTFRPSARLILTQQLRTSGLWRMLTPEDFKTLLLMLTFITPNGWCRPTLLELADAMQVSHAKARARLDRLTQLPWQGQPLIECLARHDGLDAYLPGRQLVAHKNAAPPELPQEAPLRTPGREAVVAYSRSRYAKTREEVERQIGEMMGWGPPSFAGDDPAVAEGKRQAFVAMTGFGMPKEQTLDLLSRFDLGTIESQLTWLPQRNAKNPGRFLAAAIEGGYDPPFALRRQEKVSEEQKAVQELHNASEDAQEARLEAGGSQNE